ncbi:hypothetical protein OUZ56_011623 [Daphnia magna]|uniref:Uncharacterized protein n=1 Tax=Daphnia magna TaxID=35525 RepID=A0ABQ9Z0N4_9CRUS|nr:hypothetical protein OUZ56_011623 [Daphnia magna]
MNNDLTSTYLVTAIGQMMKLKKGHTALSVEEQPFDQLKFVSRIFKSCTPPDFNLVVFELKLKLLGGAIDKQVSTMHTLVSAALWDFVFLNLFLKSDSFGFCLIQVAK